MKTMKMPGMKMPKVATPKMPHGAKLASSRPRMRRQKMSVEGKSAFPPASAMAFPGAGGTAGGAAFGPPPGGEAGQPMQPPDMGAGPPSPPEE